MDNRTFVELFAGVGLIGRALSSCGWRCVLANDICPVKRDLYYLNGGDQGKFLVKDVRDLEPEGIPPALLWTASFPCTDLSVAGLRKGMKGSASSLIMVLEDLLRKLTEEVRPSIILLENVPGLLNSNHAADVRGMLQMFQRNGFHTADVRVVDASHFSAQSRKRVFFIFYAGAYPLRRDGTPPQDLPLGLRRLVTDNADVIRFTFHKAPELPSPGAYRLSSYLSGVDSNDRHLLWAKETFTKEALARIGPRGLDILKAQKEREEVYSAVMRSRRGILYLDIVRGGGAPCLTTPGGGGSIPRILHVRKRGRKHERKHERTTEEVEDHSEVEDECEEDEEEDEEEVDAAVGGEAAGPSTIRPRVPLQGMTVALRNMTPLEYARLQGCPDFRFGDVHKYACYKAMGDAVCVPVLKFLVENVLNPSIMEH